MTVAVIAKAPVPGRVKTRLCPPCTPAEAATLAEAALADTLAAVAGVEARRRVVVLDGKPGEWLPEGFDVIPQHDGGLDRRLAGAFADLGGPTLVVGMDTPQVTTGEIQRALDALEDSDAVLGRALDGGYWCIGLREPEARALVGVPMSSDTTFTAQHARLTELGIRCALVDELRDMDTYADACAIARQAPHLRLASALTGIAA